MKKVKLLGLTSALLAFGLSGCFGPATVNEEYSTSKTQHWLEDSNGNIVGEKEEHTFVDSATGDGGKHTPIAATCTTRGKKVQVCSVCQRYVDIDVPPLNHDLIDVEGSTSGAEICEKGGTLHKVCNRQGCTYEIEEEVPARGHSLKAAVATAKEGVSKVTCNNSGCTYVAYELDITKATGWHDSATKWNAKEGANTTATWDVSGVIEDGTYAIELEAKTTSSGHTDRLFSNQYATDTGENADKESESPFRYFFKLNNSTVVNPDTTKTWGDLGYSDTAFANARIVSSIEISGLTSFSALHGNIGYSMFVSKVTLVKIA